MQGTCISSIAMVGVSDTSQNFIIHCAVCTTNEDFPAIHRPLRDFASNRLSGTHGSARQQDIKIGSPHGKMHTTSSYYHEMCTAISQSKKLYLKEKTLASPMVLCARPMVSAPLSSRIDQMIPKVRDVDTATTTRHAFDSLCTFDGGQSVRARFVGTSKSFVP